MEVDDPDNEARLGQAVLDDIVALAKDRGLELQFPGETNDSAEANAG